MSVLYWLRLCGNIKKMLECPIVDVAPLKCSLGQTWSSFPYMERFLPFHWDSVCFFVSWDEHYFGPPLLPHILHWAYVYTCHVHGDRRTKNQTSRSLHKVGNLWKPTPVVLHIHVYMLHLYIRRRNRSALLPALHFTSSSLCRMNQRAHPIYSTTPVTASNVTT